MVNSINPPLTIWDYDKKNKLLKKESNKKTEVK